MEKQIENTMINMYLDYVNNFLTIERFAEYYNLSVDGAKFVISEGRNLNSLLTHKDFESFLDKGE